MGIEIKSETEKTETLTSRYLPGDLEKINAMSGIFGVKPRIVPVICVRLVFPMVGLFQSQFIQDVVSQVTRYYVHNCTHKDDV